MQKTHSQSTKTLHKLQIAKSQFEPWNFNETIFPFHTNMTTRLTQLQENLRK